MFHDNSDILLSLPLLAHGDAPVPAPPPFRWPTNAALADLGGGGGSSSASVSSAAASLSIAVLDSDTSR